MCRLISVGIVLTKQVSVKSEVLWKNKKGSVHCVLFLFLQRACEAYVSHQPSVTLEVTSEPWRACTMRQVF